MKLLGLLIVTFCILIFAPHIKAGQGCCSYHKGQAYCDSTVGRWVCIDGTYSPTCTCPIINRTFPPMNASPQFIPNYSKPDFTVSVKLDDPNPTKYSVVLSKCRGCDPGPLTDYTSPNFQFKNIASGTWYMNAKKEIAGYWSTVRYWTITVPEWTKPTPTPTPSPSVATNTSSSNTDILGIIIVMLFAFFAILLCLYVSVKIAAWIINFVKSNEWGGIVLIWTIILAALWIYSQYSSNKAPSVSTSSSKKYICNCSKTCPSMSCSEAYFQLKECGCSARDGNRNGIPCEAQCR